MIFSTSEIKSLARWCLDGKDLRFLHMTMLPILAYVIRSYAKFQDSSVGPLEELRDAGNTEICLVC